MIAKKTFNNLNDLLNYVRDQVYESMDTTVKNELVEEVKDNIQDMVYDNPPDNEIDYVRTYQLRDSVVGETKRSQKEVHLKIFNDTNLITGHPSWVAPYAPQSKNIPYWIIGGTNSPLYSHPDDRDYIQETKDNLEVSNRHVDLLKNSLNKKGIRTV